MAMGKTNNPEILNGLFEGSYEAYKKRDEKEANAGLRQSVMEYVNRLMPVVASDYKEDYSKIWLDILEEEAVSSVIYNRGKQQGTLFNRNLVAQISLEDVRKCYGYDKDTAVYTRIRRLTDNGIAERIQTGEDKGKYKKVVKMLV